MSMPKLNFDNSNNACQSLRFLAEMIRRGELKCVAMTDATDGKTMLIAVGEMSAELPLIKAGG
jgi:hypothetical protein